MNLSLTNELVNYVYATMYFVRNFRSDPEDIKKAEEVVRRIEKAWEYEGKRQEKERFKRYFKKKGYTKREINKLMKEFFRKDDDKHGKG